MLIPFLSFHILEFVLGIIILPYQFWAVDQTGKSGKTFLSVFILYLYRPGCRRSFHHIHSPIDFNYVFAWLKNIEFRFLLPCTQFRRFFWHCFHLTTFVNSSKSWFSTALLLLFPYLSFVPSSRRWFNKFFFKRWFNVSKIAKRRLNLFVYWIVWGF